MGDALPIVKQSPGIILPRTKNCRSMQVEQLAGKPQTGG